MDDLRQFNLVELLLPDHAARIAPIGTRLGAKVRCMANEHE